MRGIHVLYVVVVTLLSPHYAWSPTTAVCHSQLWRAKNKLRLPNFGSSRWISAQCASWVTSPPDSSNEDEDSTARRCAADVLALMGGSQQQRSLEASRAQELLASILFLVPPVMETKLSYRGSRVSQVRNPDSRERIWKLIRDPPIVVANLARKSVEWAGEPDAVLAELDSALHKVPDVENSNASNCVLTRHDCAKRFANQEINAYMSFLFEAIVALAPSVGFNVSLNRYDLFHGHMFTAHDTGRLGILFHCREYPEFDKKNFALNLGYCQTGSFVPCDSGMNLRNIVWLAPMPSCVAHKCSSEWLAPGALFILDAKPGGVIFKELVSEWVDVVRTIYESDFGKTVIDVNYFNVEGCKIFLT